MGFARRVCRKVFHEGRKAYRRDDKPLIGATVERIAAMPDAVISQFAPGFNTTTPKEAKK